MPVTVKICGICTAEDARAAVAAGADWLGVNFHPASPRYVEPARARSLAAAVPGATLVGVFVDAPRADVESVVRDVGLGGVQFHGEEDPEACSGFRCRTIKAIRVRRGVDAAAIAARYSTDYVLLDGYRPGVPGGTGVAIDPAAARGIPAERLIVAGGLTPETVAEVVRVLRPFAVDVASGVESRPGRKDHGKVEEFIRRAKAA